MSKSLNLIGFELHGSLATEHRNKHFNLSSLFANPPHLPSEVLEGSVDNNDGVVKCEIDSVTHGIPADTLENLLHFLGLERHGLIGGTNESGDLRRIAHDAPRFIGRYHIDQHVAGKNFVARLGAAAIFYFD